MSLTRVCDHSTFYSYGAKHVKYSLVSGAVQNLSAQLMAAAQNLSAQPLNSEMDWPRAGLWPASLRWVAARGLSMYMIR